MIEITSSSNSLFKTLSSLTTSKGIKKENLFILSGKALIKEFLANPNFEIVYELITADLSPLTNPKKVKQTHISSVLFKELDVLGTGYNLLVLKLPNLSSWLTNGSSHGLSVLCPLGDPSNLGALARSAEAFGAHHFILLKEASHPFLPKALKASAGSLLRLSLSFGPSIEDLSELGLKNLVTLDLNGENLTDFRWHKNTFLLVGEEGQGLPKKLKAQRLKVPIQKVESLNATVAASIALYSYSLSK